MAKRSVDTSNGEWLEPVEDTLETLREEYSQRVIEVSLPPSKTVALQLQINCILKTQGSVSGNIYVFSGAGSIVDVDERDVPKMLEKSLGRPCCSPSASKYFVLA